MHWLGYWKTTPHAGKHGAGASLRHHTHDSLIQKNSFLAIFNLPLTHQKCKPCNP